MSEVPTAASERIDALDELRGIALFGVLLVNLVTGFRVSLFDPYVPRGWDPDPPAIDVAISGVITRFVELKALAIFSILFGMGLALQRGKSTRIARRLAMLLAIGLVHMFLIWNGDILVLYAVVGIIATPLLRLPTIALLLFALAALSVQLAPIPFPTAFPSLDALQTHVRDAHDIYGHGTFLEILAFRIREVRPMSKVLLISAPQTLGLFLLGAFFARTALLRPPRNRLVLGALALTGIGVGLSSTPRPWGALALALGYMATIVLLSEFRVLRIFAPLGRMALTSYLSQSVILGFLFYGFGLGLFGRIGLVTSVEIAVAIYVGQMIASALWLRRFRFGPVEWLWRSFTYGAWQPFKRRA